MLDMGILEIGVVAVVALLVIGPERMPTVARKAGKMLGSVRRMWANVKEDIDKAADFNVHDKPTEDERTSSKEPSSKDVT